MIFKANLTQIKEIKFYLKFKSTKIMIGINFWVGVVETHKLIAWKNKSKNKKVFCVVIWLTEWSASTNTNTSTMLLDVQKMCFSSYNWHLHLH